MNNDNNDPKIGSIETGTNWRGEPTILNVEEFRKAIESMSWLAPDGTEVHYEVEDPHLNDDPTNLRIKGHRKGLWFNVIHIVNLWGLEVRDVWQHNVDQEDDQLCIKVAPKREKIEFPAQTIRQKVVATRQDISQGRLSEAEIKGRLKGIEDLIYEAER
jgi:hypothetical protein